MNEEKIIYTEWAVANVYKDGTIEIHQDLEKPEWKKLKNKILNHERDHNFNKGFIYNLKVDFFNFICSHGLLQFMITRPKTWIQILPFYYIPEKGFVYDKNVIFFYTIIAISIFTIIKLIGGI